MIIRTVNEIMELYRWAYSEVVPAFRRMERYSAAYDNIIDQASWPTMSEIPIPSMFVAVEQALPFTLDYLYPDNHFLTLVPSSAGASFDQTQRVERLLHDVLRVNMNLRHTQEPTIRDVFKLGVGYGLVEPQIVTPPTDFIANIYDDDGEKLAEESYVAPGEPMLIENYRYLSVGQVIPLPGKPDPDTADGYFILEILTESDITDLYNSSGLRLKSSAEAIVNEARRERFDSRLDLATFLAKLGGKSMTMRPQQRQYMPLIPILKFYERHGEYWLANGRTLIYQRTSETETFGGPLVKASAWSDGQRWFPVSVAEAAEGLHRGINIYFNALMDLFTDHWHPQRVVNKKLIPDDAPRDPYQDIQCMGDPEKAIGYVSRPQINPAVFTIGDMLSKYHAQAVGQPGGLNGAGSPGLVRSGANAFESLMQTPIGREKIAAAHLETGMMQNTVKRAVILAQALTDEKGRRYPVERWNEQMKRKYYEHETVTVADMNMAWGFKIDLRDKLRSAGSDFQIRSGVFDRIIKTPFIDHKEAINYLADDERIARRLMLPDEVVKKRAEAEYKMQMMERAKNARQTGESGVEGDIADVPSAAQVPQ